MGNGRELIERIGKRYKALTVTRFIKMDETKKHSYWECLCDCGKMAVVRSNNLVNGHTQSCGCKKLKNPINAVKRRKPDGDAAFCSVYTGYKSSAKKRHISFNLSKVDFKKLCLDKCFYCNCAPRNILGSWLISGTFTYNGIDRVNNTLGYSIDNCVPCCKICNFMKKNLTQEEFLNHVESIYRNTRKGKANEKS